MSNTTRGLNEQAKAPKIGGKIQFTYEVLHSLLMVPDECHIKHIEGDPNRDILSVYFHADEARRGTAYLIGEGQEYPTVSVPIEHYALKALRFAKEIEEKAEQGVEWAEHALKIFELEKESNE